MRKTVRLVYVGVLAVMLSACVNMNKNMQQDLNVLNAKVGALEKNVTQLAVQQNELHEIVAGEQKRGEYLQRQLSVAPQGVAVSQSKNNASTKTTAKSIPYTDGKKFISKNMSNQPAVRDVQLALRNAGFYDGAVDGVAGSQTRQAVKAYQRSEGLRDDGVIGRRTWNKLGAYK